MELALDDREVRGRVWPGGDVSILVFVELALDDLDVRSEPGDGAGFNPCFRGTCS